MTAAEYLHMELPVDAAPDRLIIDRRYTDLVERRLAELRIEIVGRAEVAAFDLARLELSHETNHRDEFVVDVDAVIAELRWRFAAAFGGWTPLLGKDRRLANQVGAYPQTRSMFATSFDPEPASAPSLPEVSDVGRGVRVGVLDTKLYDHPYLQGRYETPNGPGTVLSVQDPEDWENGHAAFVSGLILSRAPGATLVVRDVLDNHGKAFTWDTVEELGRFLEDRPRVDVLNLSFGCRTNDGLPPGIMRRAIERLTPHMVVVAAAGNHGEIDGMVNGVTSRSATWPAAMPDVIAVSATTSGGELAAYSPVLPWVTATAEADAVTSLYLHGEVQLPKTTKSFGGYATWRGSSFATALVSGAIAAGVGPGVTAHDVVASGTAFHPYTWNGPR